MITATTLRAGPALSVSARDEGPKPTRPAAREPHPWKRIGGLLRGPSAAPKRTRRSWRDRGPWPGGPVPAAA